jgi:hypothetical protein
VFLVLLCCTLRDEQLKRQALANASGKGVSKDSPKRLSDVSAEPSAEISPKRLSKVSPAQESFGGFNDQSAPHPSTLLRTNVARGSVLPSHGWTKSFDNPNSASDDGSGLQQISSSADLVYEAMLH